MLALLSGLLGAVITAGVTLWIYLHGDHSSSVSGGAQPGSAVTVTVRPTPRPSHRTTTSGSTQTGSGQGVNAPSTPASRATRSALVRVAFDTLCNEPSAEVYICPTGSDSGAEVGGRLFTYVGETNDFSGARPPYWDHILSLDSLNCRHLTVQFAQDDRHADPGSVANLELVQQSGTSTASAQKGQIGTLSVDLDHGPIHLSGNSTDSSAVLVNGYATGCDPSEG